MNSNQVFRKKDLAMAVSTACTLLAGSSANVAFAQDIEEVTVTGSRITKRDLDAPSPILTVGAENFEMNANVSVESVMNKLPQ